MKANTLCINSIYIHALLIIGISTALTYVTYLIFITLKLWISKVKKNRTCVDPITPVSNKLQEKGNSRPQDIVITVTSPSVHDFNQNTRAVRGSENPGVPVSFGGHNLFPLIEKVNLSAKIWGCHGTHGTPRDNKPAMFKFFKNIILHKLTVYFQRMDVFFNTNLRQNC